jgi:ATP-binding cassette subfamily B protein
MSSLKAILRRSSLLEEASEGLLTALAAQAKIVQLPLAQTFQRSGQLPPGPAMLLEGRLRRLINIPGRPPSSLGFVEPGTWISWTALWRGEPEVTLTASQPSALLMIPASAAVHFLQSSQELRALLATPSFEEVASLLFARWVGDGLLVPQPLPVLKHWISQCRLVSLDQAVCTAQDEDLMFSGPRQPKGAIPGDRLLIGSEELRQAQSTLINGLPQRVLVLPRAALDQPTYFNSPADPESTTPEPPGAITVTGQTVDREALQPADPADHGFVGDTPPTLAPFSKTASASNRVEQAVACVLYLAGASKITYSEELIRRNLSDIEQRLGALRLPQIGLQLEALGLETRPLRARPWDLSRLEPPVMLEIDGGFVLLLAAGRGGGVLIGDPREGLKRISLRHLEESFPDGLELLLIREGERQLQGEGFGLSWFLPAFQAYPAQIFTTLATGFIGQLLATVLPLGWMLVINAVVGVNNSSLLLPMTVVLLVATVTSSILNAIRGLIAADLSDRVDVRLGASVVEHLLRLPLPYFESRQVGAILFNVNQLYSIRKFLVDQLLGVGLDLVFSVVFLVVLLIVSPPLTLLTLAIVPVLLFINIAATPILQRQIKESNRQAAAASSYLVEVLSGMRTVKSQNFEVEARWEWLNRYRRFTNSRFRLTQLGTLVSEGANLVSGIFDVALLVVAALLILSNQLSVGALFAVRILAQRMVSPLLRLSGVWQGFQEMKISLAALSEIMLAIPESGTIEESQAIPLPQIKGDLRFEDISFRYGDQGPMLIDGLNLDIEAGQFVGIAGLSGSGKSTLVQMVDRLYKPKNGAVYLDGYDIAKVQLSSLRRRIGYVPQDSLLFEGTVLDNIRLNNPDADIEAVMVAARIAGAHDFILDLAKGYATHLGERGTGLSGGQRQRICIARTVLQEPSLLILDEATSALDADMELQVCRNLSRHFKESTVLFITHRLTTLRQADRILFMDKGVIVEDGDHDTLIQHQGAYATLYRQQVGTTSTQGAMS